MTNIHSKARQNYAVDMIDYKCNGYLRGFYFIYNRK